MPKLIQQTKLHLISPNDCRAFRYVEKALDRAFQKSSRPIDLEGWRNILDPEGNPSFKKPPAEDMAKIKKFLREYYKDGRNVKTVLESHFNPFKVKSQDVMVDFLTDSGTGNLYPQQIAFMNDLLGGESPLIPNAHTYAYAGSVPRQLLNYTVNEIFGRNFKVYAALQGRSAEFLLMNALATLGVIQPGNVVLSNKPFDTTKGHIENIQEVKGNGMVETDKEIVKCHVISCTPLTTPQTFDARADPFLGNMPMDTLGQKYDENPANAKIMLITVNDNGGGGQPSSIARIKEAAKWAHERGLLVWIDGCRVFHNAMANRLYEDGYNQMNNADIAKEIFSHADIVTISVKKMNSHSGALLLLNSESRLLAGKVEQMGMGIMKTTTVMYGNGFNSYCGLTGSEMIEMVSGLLAMMDPQIAGSVLAQPIGAHRIARHYGMKEVVGEHAVYFAADQELPNVPLDSCPAELMAGVAQGVLGMRICGLGRMLYENPEMDSLRAAIERYMYPTTTINFMFQFLGMMHQEGIFKDIPSGLGYEDQANPDKSFGHFYRKLFALDPTGVERTIRRGQELVSDTLHL